VVYAKPPFAGPAATAVLASLSCDTHRVAISNQRLLAMDERGVTFRWKDYRAKGRTRHKRMTLAADAKCQGADALGCAMSALMLLCSAVCFLSVSAHRGRSCLVLPAPSFWPPATPQYGDFSCRIGCLPVIFVAFGDLLAAPRRTPVARKPIKSP